VAAGPSARPVYRAIPAARSAGPLEHTQDLVSANLCDPGEPCV